MCNWGGEGEYVRGGGEVKDVVIWEKWREWRGPKHTVVGVVVPHSSLSSFSGGPGLLYSVQVLSLTRTGPCPGRTGALIPFHIFFTDILLCQSHFIFGPCLARQI